jgi:hypothetical protein
VRALGRAAARTVEERFDIDGMARRVGEAYRALSARKGRRRG